MCKYSSVCSLCHQEIQVEAEQLNTNDVNVKISSDCPNLKELTGKTIKLDAVHEMIVPKEKTDFFRILSQYHTEEGCTVYDSVMEAVGKNLGRYYELA